jgi:hypothetical protein
MTDGRDAAAEVTRSMLTALEDLRLDTLDVIHPGEETFVLRERIRAVALARVDQDIDPL